MQIIVDTNVMLDIFLKRENFYFDSSLAIEKCIKKQYKIYFSSNCITDVYYLIKKNLKDDSMAYNSILDLCEFMKIVSVGRKEIYSALSSNIKDFEDAVLDASAISISADYILTRNVDGFKNAVTKAITPADFINAY